MVKKIHIFISMLFLSSCDCMVTTEGMVFDEQTKKPLDGVLVKNLKYSELGEKTKEDGAFKKVEIGRENGKCLEFNLEFSKIGYITDTIFVENASSLTVYLKKK